MGVAYDGMIKGGVAYDDCVVLHIQQDDIEKRVAYIIKISGEEYSLEK